MNWVITSIILALTITSQGCAPRDVRVSEDSPVEPLDREVLDDTSDTDFKDDYFVETGFLPQCDTDVVDTWTLPSNIFDDLVIRDRKAFVALGVPCIAAGEKLTLIDPYNNNPLAQVEVVQLKRTHLSRLKEKDAQLNDQSIRGLQAEAIQLYGSKADTSHLTIIEIRDFLLF